MWLMLERLYMSIKLLTHYNFLLQKISKIGV